MHLHLAAAILPALLLCLYLGWRSRQQTATFKYWLHCLAFGILSALPSILLEQLGHRTGIIAGIDIVMTFFFALFAVGMSEELSKFVFMRFYIFPQKSGTRAIDFVPYAISLSMGFVLAENLWYVITYGEAASMFRLLLSVPAQAGFAIILGYFMGMAKDCNDPQQGFLYMNTGLGSAIVIHGLYIFFIFQQDYLNISLLAAGTAAIAIILLFRLYKAALPNVILQEQQAQLDSLYAEKEEDL